MPYTANMVFPCAMHVLNIIAFRYLIDYLTVSRICCVWVQLLGGSRMIRWLQRTEFDVKPKLEITENNVWASLNLLLVNRSDIPIWAEQATVVLADCDTTLRISIATTQALHIICQLIRPQMTLTMSLAKAVYEAAGNSQGTYARIIKTTIRLRSGDRWYERVAQQRRLEMRALVPVSLRHLKHHEKSIDGSFPNQNKSQSITGGQYDNWGARQSHLHES
jgi:hypothetical protein